MIVARARILGAATLLLLGAHCSLFFDPDALGPGQPLVEGGAGEEAAAPSADGGANDGARDGASDGASDGRGPTGLDEHISLPDLDATPCSKPTAIDPVCGLANACRMATPDSGRCESCDTDCKLGVGKPCSRSNECDSFLTCFRGRCAGPCTLGEHACGPIEACLDVGYPRLGLCDPSTL